ncbi:MAG: FHA domain-containing protein [Planctomycetota bacterium]
MPKLIIRLQNEEWTVDLEDGSHIIGRASQCDIALKDPSLSRQHCEIQVQGSVATLIDRGSMNGTLVNGRRASTHRLLPGDKIQIGQAVLWYERKNVAAEAAPSPAPAAPPPPAPPGPEGATAPGRGRRGTAGSPRRSCPCRRGNSRSGTACGRRGCGRKGRGRSPGPAARRRLRTPPAPARVSRTSRGDSWKRSSCPRRARRPPGAAAEAARRGRFRPPCGKGPQGRPRRRAGG